MIHENYITYCIQNRSAESLPGVNTDKCSTHLYLVCALSLKRALNVFATLRIDTFRKYFDVTTFLDLVVNNSIAKLKSIDSIEMRHMMEIKKFNLRTLFNDIYLT